MNADPLLFRQGFVILSVVTYWAGVAANARRLRRHLGRSPNIRPRGRRERVLWLGWILVVIAWAGQPFLVGARGAFPMTMLPENLLGPAGFVLGLVLLAAGQAGTFWCYASLGHSWRIGIDRKERTDLVTHGPYRLVRHPIYAFQVCLLLGMTCLIPTFLSVVIVAVHLVLVMVKSRDEERHLRSVCPAEYGEYLERTGMLLPNLRGLRRLSSSEDIRP